MSDGVSFIPCECRKLSDMLVRSTGKHIICSKFCRDSVHDSVVWLVQFLDDRALPYRVVIFDDPLQFEKFYVKQKKRFRYEKQEKQFNPDVREYNGKPYEIYPESVPLPY